MSRELDEPLGWSDRAAIRMHMLVCGPCRHFKQHLVVLRGVFRNVSRGEAVGSDDAPLTLSNERKQQIRDELKRLKG